MKYYHSTITLEVVTSGEPFGSHIDKEFTNKQSVLVQLRDSEKSHQCCRGSCDILLKDITCEGEMTPDQYKILLDSYGDPKGMKCIVDCDIEEEALNQ